MEDHNSQMEHLRGLLVVRVIKVRSSSHKVNLEETQSWELVGKYRDNHQMDYDTVMNMK